MFGDFDPIGILFGLCFVFVPLGIWKVIDIIIWIIKNVNINIGG